MTRQSLVADTHPDCFVLGYTKKTGNDTWMLG